MAEEDLIAQEYEKQQEEIDCLNISNLTEHIEKKRLRPLTSFLNFDVSNRPSQAKDYISKGRVLFGISIGLFLIGLGFLTNIHIGDIIKPELQQGVVEKSSSFSASWLFIGLGSFIILTRVLLLFYGREFFIGNKFATVVLKKPFETSKRLADSLDSYVGVRYRTRIVRLFGLASYTQHIIDLQHPNETKTIPLYISNNGMGACRRWEELCRQLDKPAIFNTADGIVSVKPENIQKALPKQIREGRIEIDDKTLYQVPKHFKIAEDSKSCKVDILIRDSAFSLLSAIICLFLFFGTAFLEFVIFSGQPEQSVILPCVLLTVMALFLFVMIPISLFFRRRRIIISKNGLRIRSKWLFFPSVGIIISPEELQLIEVVDNSYDFKYSLVIGAEGHTTHLGRGLSKDELRWMKNFLYAQIRHFVCGYK